MRRTDVISRLKSTEPSLRRLGVDGLFLFGSHARDEAAPTSDVDVFVDPVSMTTFGFTPFMDALAVIEAAVATKVHYGTRSGLHPKLKAGIEQQAIRIF